MRAWRPLAAAALLAAACAAVPARAAGAVPVLAISGKGGDVWTMHVDATREARFFDFDARRLPAPAGTAGGVLIRSLDLPERTRGEIVVNEQPFGRRDAANAVMRVPLGVDEQLPAGDYVVTLVGSVGQTYRIPLSGSAPPPTLRPTGRRSITHSSYAVTPAVQVSWAEPVAISSRDFVFHGYMETGQHQDVHALSVCVTGGSNPCSPVPQTGASIGSDATHWSGAAGYHERGFYLDGPHTWLGAGASAAEAQQFERHLVTVEF